MVKYLSSRFSGLSKKSIVEAVLYAAGKPVKILTLAKKAKTTPKRVIKIVEELIREYDERESAIEIVFIDDMAVMQLKSEYTPYVVDLSPFPLTKTDLKVLSLLALKQTMPQAEIVKKIGKHAYTHLKRLEKKGYIARENKEGVIYISLTKLSKEYFGLSSKYLKESIEEKRKQKVEEDLKKYLSKK